MNKKIKIVMAIALAVFLVLAGYFGYKKYFNKPKLENKNPSSVIKILPDKPSQTKNSVTGFKLYKNIEFGFEIQYPVSWMVTEEINENVRGEMVKEFFFKKPSSDLRFAILPKDGLSYGVEAKGTSTPAYIGGSTGIQTQYVLKDGRRLWLLFPQYGLHNWLEDLGRIDAMTSVENPAGDTQIFEQMLNSFKLAR
ncbi:MAG: hypothetical protein AAB456_01900 [Patescibacteria group bacterium]